MSPGTEHLLRIGDGRIVVPHATYQCFMPAASAAALLWRNGMACLVPLSGPVAGGMLLKQRNALGDRVMFADDFLAPCGLGRFSPEREFVVRWSDDVGALYIEGLEAVTDGRTDVRTDMR